MSERPRACWCVANGKETCDCEVPFIGNFAEADRRIKAGTLKSLEMEDVKAAVKADALAFAERLIPIEPKPATVTIVLETPGGESHG